LGWGGGVWVCWFFVGGGGGGGWGCVLGCFFVVCPSGKEEEKKPLRASTRSTRASKKTKGGADGSQGKIDWLIGGNETRGRTWGSLPIMTHCNNEKNGRVGRETNNKGQSINKGERRMEKSGKVVLGSMQSGKKRRVGERSR